MNSPFLRQQQERIDHAMEVASGAQRVREATTARCIQELVRDGYSQREIADRLGMSKSTVNRLATASITYTPEGAPAADVCDAVESAAWGTPVRMRDAYIAITGSHTTCPRCGEDLETPQGRFCPQCRFPFGELYQPPAVDQSGGVRIPVGTYQTMDQMARVLGYDSKEALRKSISDAGGRFVLREHGWTYEADQ